MLVTGSSGALGSWLVEGLLAHPLVGEVTALDLAPWPRSAHRRLRSVKADARDAVYLRSILEEGPIDTVFHLVNRPEGKHDRYADSLASDTAMALLDAASRAPRVEKLVLFSTAWAYGPRWRNAVPLTEEHPLRATGMGGAAAARAMEEAIEREIGASARATLQVSILRFCPVAGLGGAPRAAAPKLAALPFAPSVLLRDCPLQFLDAEDARRALLKVFEARQFHGVFNIAPDGWTTLKTIHRRLGRLPVPLPYFAVWLTLYACRLARPEWDLGEADAPYLRYPVVLDNAKFKKAADFDFKKSSEEAFLGAWGTKVASR